jgi:MoaA/NifB/PqqE/SkfB family radical SAM enzyme
MVPGVVNMKIYREELFGGIIYDDRTLSYRAALDAREKNEADRIISLARRPRRADVLSAPVRIYFELTTRCNLSCSHCFAESHPALPEGMPRGLIFRLLEDMKESGVINVRFTGGEPTARNDWYEICSYAHELGLIVSLNTNGVFDDPDGMAEKIASLGMEQVTLSMDGLEESHDALRGKGSFRAVRRALESLHAHGLNLRLTTVLTRDNLGEIPELVELAHGYVKVINFVCLRPIGRASQKGKLMPGFYEHSQSAAIVRSLQNTYADLLILHSDLPLPELLAGREQAGDSPGDACTFSSTPLAIAADGSFWPHHYSAHQSESFRLGRFPDQRIDDIWLHSPVLDRFRTWTSELRRRCTGCPEYGKRCAGANFEMEIAKVLGHIKENPYCIASTEAPLLADLMIQH